MTRPLFAVIKVGGSLFDWPELPDRLTAFLGVEFPPTRTSTERPLLIAGGGPAVDVVRDLDRIHRLTEETAHHLALHGMDLAARLLTAIVPGTTLIDSLAPRDGALLDRALPVLAPVRTVCAIDRAEPDWLPASWSVTSDSIAARIALHFNASRLILLKSTAIRRDATRHEAAEIGFVDPFFPIAAHGVEHVEYLNLRSPTASLQVLVA
jgi:aspartokinase-like uncharacterized kinase